MNNWTTVEEKLKKCQIKVFTFMSVRLLMSRFEFEIPQITLFIVDLTS